MEQMRIHPNVLGLCFINIIEGGDLIERVHTLLMRVLNESLRIITRPQSSQTQFIFVLEMHIFFMASSACAAVTVWFSIFWFEKVAFGHCVKQSYCGGVGVVSAAAEKVIPETSCSAQNDT